VFIGFYAILLGLILTIACLNLANMLLARGAARRRELAIRLAVGASRFRLIRQLMSEGILLALLSGAAGLALAFWFVHLSSQMKLPVAVPIALEATLDWHAILFTLVLSAACGIGFSIAPALQATKADVGPTLKEGAAIQLRGYRRFGMRNILVVGQVAGSLMLLLLTGFLVIGMARTSDVQTKFDPNTMYLLSIDPVRDGYSPEKARAFFESLPQRLRQVPAVRNVALAAQPPFSIEAGTGSVTTAPSAHDTAKTVNAIAHNTISTGFFAALNEPMLQGREFEDRDQRLDDSRDVIHIILNQTAALALFGSGSAIGQRIMEDKKSYEVIGLTRDLKSGMATADSSSVVYLPLTGRDFASPPPGGMTIIVRSGGGPDAMTGVRREIEQIDPNLAVFDVRTLAEYLDISRSYMRMGATIYGGIGVFGLLLAAIGLAGVTAYAVARRRKEIGIRMALGARQAQVLRLVLREGITLVAIGTILGFLGAMAMSKALASLTDIFTQAFQMGTNDPRLVLGAPVLLAALAMLACYIPARRSAKIDPLKALREE
jgi:predicted permease